MPEPRHFGIRFPNVGPRRLGFVGITIDPYLLRDEFYDTVSAGSVNNTLATPSAQVRTVIDANSKISVGSGVLNFATGGAANDGVWYPSFTRKLGRAIVAEVTPTGGAIEIGWDFSASGNLADSIQFTSNLVRVRINNGTIIPLGAYATGTSYKVAVVMRLLGGYSYYIKGGAFTNWTFLYCDKTSTLDRLPGINSQATTTVATSNYFRVPSDLILIQPIASDNFSGAWGITGGGGSEESGGSGLPWTAQKGTWGSGSGVASCSALADSVGIATVDCGTANVVAEIVATRSAGTSGLCLRYTDANNYIKAVHDGTNYQVIEVVAGTPNTLISAAATYGAAFRAVITLDGTKVRAFYNNAAIGSEATTAIITGPNHGLFTDDTGATFDNFVSFFRGTGGELDATLNQYANP